MDDLKKWGVKLSDAAASAFDFERYAVEEPGLILSEDGQVYIGKIGAAPRQTMEALPGMLLE